MRVYHAVSIDKSSESLPLFWQAMSNIYIPDGNKLDKYHGIYNTINIIVNNCTHGIAVVNRE